MKLKYLIFIISAIFFVLFSLFLYINLKASVVSVNEVKVKEKVILDYSIKDAKEKIQKLETQKVYINLPNRSTALTYKEIGITFNIEPINRYTKLCENDCVLESDMLLRELANEIVKIDKDKYNVFIHNLDQDIVAFLDTPNIDFINYTFKGYSPNATIEVDKEDLNTQLTPENLLRSDVLNIKVNIKDNNDKQNTIKLIKDITNSPLLIKYGRQPIYIKNEDLLNFISLETKNNSTEAKINFNEIEKYIHYLEETYNLKIELEKNAAIKSIAHALLFRAGGEAPATAVILPLVGQSKTKGKYANKYLEINKSQQRMYAFENNKLIKTYIVGTGLTWETPSGEFKILRKEGTAISYFGNWYMPYYMPIGVVNGSYFFGFHEIPYQINSKGYITSRDVNTMGSPATGGCIQLYNEDAKELYDWVDVGTPVIIYE